MNQQQQTLHMDIAAKAQNLLRMDALEYAEFMERMGIQYLRRNLGLPEEYIDHITREKLFWSWWKIQWYVRESEWIKTAGKTDLTERRRSHVIQHHPTLLERKPHRAVLENTYAVMMQNIIDQKPQAI